MSNKFYQTGMTLIELMIALLIGAFLLGGVIQIFIGSQQTYRMLENLSRLQENGRFALDFLARDIRMAGFLGCSDSITPNVIIDPKNPNPNPLPPTLSFATAHAILGDNNIVNNWNTNACGTNACITGTDAVTFYSGSSCGGQLTGNMASNNANIQINAANTCNISAYDVLIISDCSAADIFIASSASSGSGTQTIAHANNQNTDNKLSKAYGADAEIFAFNASSTYFIRADASGQPALWRFNNAKAVTIDNPVELIEGVENMQVLYGAMTNSTPPNYYYTTANNVADMAKVVSVRISLLLASDDNITVQSVPYTYNGTTTTPTDRKIRHVLTTTIALRNRLP
ncbi:PilW family protein [Methylobacter psychrophilus]|uniref:PilW family protein n=1 Tax=Methylobacter psychrophilus TaxID=96941 RepID=UPI0021D4D7B2|nr:PilW family protein [Methylobacter psychrophilus]